MMWMMLMVMVVVMMIMIKLATEICLCHLPPTSTQSNVVPSLRLFSLSLEPFYTDGGPISTLDQGSWWNFLLFYVIVVRFLPFRWLSNNRNWIWNSFQDFQDWFSQVWGRFPAARRRSTGIHIWPKSLILGRVIAFPNLRIICLIPS